MKKDYTEEERYALADKLRYIYEHLYLVDSEDFDWESAQDDLEDAIALVSPRYAKEWDEAD